MARKPTNRHVKEYRNAARELGYRVPNNATYASWLRKFNKTDDGARVKAYVKSNGGINTFAKRRPKSARATEVTQEEVKTFSTQIKGGEYVEAKGAQNIKRSFADIGDRRVALRISFESDPKFISIETIIGASGLTADRLPRGEGKGTSGRGSLTPDGAIVYYVGHEAGFKASDVLALINYYGSAYDAMYVLWSLYYDNAVKKKGKR